MLGTAWSLLYESQDDRIRRSLHKHQVWPGRLSGRADYGAEKTRTSHGLTGMSLIPAFYAAPGEVLKKH